MSKVAQYINLSSGETLPFSVEADGVYVDQDTDINTIEKEIKNNFSSPVFRIFVLYPDETINYEIPNSVIKAGGSYNENYQDGQRRTLSFTLYNFSGEFTPNINRLWAGTRLRFDQGLKLSSGVTVWFQKGVYVITKITPSLSSSGREVQVNANDKFSLFEGATGKLETSYTIKTGSIIEDVIRSILLTEMGDGYVLDPQRIVYNSAFKGKTTQAEISKSAGDTLGSILLELGTQLSAEVFYNANGNLVYAPTTEVTTDSNKPLIYEYKTAEGDISQLNFDLDYSSIVNRIVVLGNSSDGGVYQAVAVNGDPKSPLCYQRIGIRTGDIINDSNITTDLLAQERAEYELRQLLIIKTTSSATVAFNPFLEVNNLVAISDEFFGLDRERFLIQSVSCSLDYSGTTNISFSNLDNISTSIEINTGSGTPQVVSNTSAVDDRAKYEVLISYGEGVMSSFLSLNPTATEGCLSGTQFYKGDVVYGFVVINGEEYSPQEAWVSVTENVYCVGSARVSDSALDLGYFVGIQKWHEKWVSENSKGQLVYQWGRSDTLPAGFNITTLSSKIVKENALTRISGYLHTSDARVIILFGQAIFPFEGVMLESDKETGTLFIDRQEKESTPFKTSVYTIHLQGGGANNPTTLNGYIELQSTYRADRQSTTTYLPCDLYLTKIDQNEIAT